MRKKHHGIRYMCLIVGVILFVAAVLESGWLSKIQIENYVGDVSAQESDGLMTYEQAKNITEVTQISGENYAYQQLSEEEKLVYDQILECILEQQEKVGLATTQVPVIERAYAAVSADYGGLFWISGYVYTQHSQNDQVIAIDFKPQYTMTYEERIAYQEQVDLEVERFLDGMVDTQSDYEKAKYVFENLISQVDYSAEVQNDQNILSVFLEKKTVCQGYACATQYLLELLNIPCVIVSGTAGGESHAWNLVQLDGEYYYMDTTWGNSAYMNEDSEEKKYVNYNYLCMTSEEISKTHVPNENFTLPECTALADNYYVREGLYVEQFDADGIGTLYRTAYENGQEALVLKFSDDTIYQQTKDYFIEERHIADYCSISSVYYLDDENHHVLTVYFN